MTILTVSILFIFYKNQQKIGWGSNSSYFPCVRKQFILVLNLSLRLAVLINVILIKKIKSAYAKNSTITVCKASENDPPPPSYQARTGTTGHTVYMFQISLSYVIKSYKQSFFVKGICLVLVKRFWIFQLWKRSQNIWKRWF